MIKPAHEPAILQGARRVRYLKLIALFKIGKGALLLLLGVSLLFLNARTRWMDAISDWTADEILLEHSKGVAYLLQKLQAVLAGGALRATGFFGAVLFGGSFHRRNRRLHAATLGRATHDFRDRRPDST
jgi:predicted membrane protein DUF2127